MSTSTGNNAEDSAATYLASRGYEIIARNWKTPLCEIDIVVKKNNVISFVEVKYRSSANQGTGLEYITPKKLQQMRFAANCWVSDTQWSGDYYLSGIEVTGDYKVTEFIDVIE
ncbi:YraN family protein [Candidatus Saccharibacteria bacterium]|nr:YraN family protein [Candidatus Saccharibacteria bacterium]